MSTEVIRAFGKFHADWGFKPSAILLGPLEYLELSHTLAPGLGVQRIDRFLGVPVRVKVSPGFDFEVPLESAGRFVRPPCKECEMHEDCCGQPCEKHERYG